MESDTENRESNHDYLFSDVFGEADAEIALQSMTDQNAIEEDEALGAVTSAPNNSLLPTLSSTKATTAQWPLSCRALTPMPSRLSCNDIVYSVGLAIPLHRRCSNVRRHLDARVSNVRAS
jgi:hypothetical protein